MNAKLFRILWAVLLLPLTVCVLSFSAYAGGDEEGFDVKSTSGISADGDVEYVYLQVTNNGKDFGGYVRLIMSDGSYYDSIVYETYASVASGSTENITIGIPVPDGVNLEDYEATVKIVDTKGNELYSARQKKLFTVNASQQFGILSNSGSGLDYLEKAFSDPYNMGYYGGSNAEDKWTSLYMMPAELTDGYTLKQMSYLFIDDYDLSSLKSDQIEAIEEWTRLGGVLVIGTGSNLDHCFSAFDKDFINLELGNKYTYSSFSYYSNTGYITVADLVLKKGYNQICYGELHSQIVGRGAIVVANFSLSDPDLDKSFFGVDLYTNLTSIKASSGSSAGSNYHLTSHDMEVDYGVMQGRSTFSPTLLRVMVIFYVILVGPGVYLILKKFKKRELIWFAVPAISFVFVLLVFLISRGFDMRSRQFTTVRIVNADGKEEETDYIMGYSANRNDWSITLNDNAGAAGPVNYVNMYSHNSKEDQYQYKTSNNTAGMQLFYSPNSGFDNAYFKVKADNSLTGGGMKHSLELDNSKIVGELENGTDYDFDHVILVCYGYYDMIDNVKSGDKITINSKSRQRYSNESTLEDLAKKYYNYGEYDEARLYMAMFFAAHELNDHGSFVIGVCKGSEKLIKGNVAEDKYLCVYGVD